MVDDARPNSCGFMVDVRACDDDVCMRACISAVGQSVAGGAAGMTTTASVIVVSALEVESRLLSLDTYSHNISMYPSFAT